MSRFKRKKQQVEKEMKQEGTNVCKMLTEAIERIGSTKEENGQ